MNDFFSDLLQDLRQKRLLPVAIALLVGIVAIPVALKESAAEPPVPAPTASIADVPGRSPLRLDVSDAESSAKGSALDAMARRNPFEPPAAVTASKAQASSDTAGASDPAGDGGGGAAGSPSDPGSSGGTGGGGTGGGGQAPSEPPPVQTVKYQYVADVTFWSGDRRRDRRLRKLDMLPNQTSPVLIFMGVTDNGGDAVFLVDSSLDARGEGTCVPNRANCTFVHIGAGAEHLFTAETGESYRLRVNEILRVKVRPDATTSDRQTAETANGSVVRGRPFSIPTLIDAIEETGPAGTPSSPAADGR